MFEKLNIILSNTYRIHNRNLRHESLYENLGYQLKLGQHCGGNTLLISESHVIQKL